MSRHIFEITPELVLRAYRAGLFPMAETRLGSKLYWLDPEQRGILPLDQFHLPKRLLRTVLDDRFEVTSDQDFVGTIAGCAAPTPTRPDTWINPQIERLFISLYQQGHAHSVECRMDGRLVGGLYGVSLGGAFYGESMFSTVSDASKVALVHLVARLRLAGFRLLDTQFVTAHLAKFGAIEIPRDDYKALLAEAVHHACIWPVSPPAAEIRAEILRLGGGGEARSSPQKTG